MDWSTLRLEPGSVVDPELHVDTLDRWFDRALQATTLSEVLDGGAHAPRRKDS
nr:hypothetical protein [Cystobacter ferrugineus]